jgi:hypothetical protein
VIAARLDKKTRTRVLCGTESCRGEFGILHMPTATAALSDEPGLMDSLGIVRRKWPESFTEACPRCGAENIIDLQRLIDLQPLFRTM